MKKAFTLIELLVVIAIIAILAAILFPVFAQAKAAAKQSANLSNTKQLGLAFNIYLPDYDDTFPLAAVLRPNGGLLGTGVGMPFPYNDDPYPFATWASQGRQNMAKAHWANAIFPYVKSAGIYAFTGNNAAVLFAGQDVFPQPGFAQPYQDCLAFNGDLHRYPSTSVTSPSIAILAWPAFGNQNTIGREISDPQLNCGGTVDQCMFNGSGAPSPIKNINSSFWASSGDIWYYGPGSYSYFISANHRLPFVRTDSSAKALPATSSISPNFDSPNGAFVEPMASLSSAGIPGSYWPCVNGGPTGATDPLVAGNNYYWCYFRPDRQQ